MSQIEGGFAEGGRKPPLPAPGGSRKGGRSPPLHRLLAVAADGLAVAALAAPAAAVSATAAAAPSTPEAAAVAVPVAARLARRRRRQREGGRHRVHVDLLVDLLATAGQLLYGLLAAQVEPALAVDLGGLDHDLDADVDDLLDPLDAVVRQPRDVDQPVLVGQHLDEGAERHDPDDLAAVDAAHLDLVGQALDPVDRAPRAVLVGRGDEDLAVVLDVDLGAGLLDDLADHLAARADHVADLVGVDLDGRDAR